MIKLKSAQEIFKDSFSHAKTAVVQKLRPDSYNIQAKNQNFTEHWTSPSVDPDIIVLAFGEENSATRELWAGFFIGKELSREPNLYRFYVDQFYKIGTHDRIEISDSEFYGGGNGGGSRKIVENNEPETEDSPYNYYEGSMVRRLTWVRKNHEKFRDPVREYWGKQCAVSGHSCNNILIASHILPWSKSSSQEKTNVHNGLLLSAPLDTLFDRGFISFTNEGEMLISKKLSLETQETFGLSCSNKKISNPEKISSEMKVFLGRHRQLHGF